MNLSKLSQKDKKLVVKGGIWAVCGTVLSFLFSHAGQTSGGISRPLRRGQTIPLSNDEVFWILFALIVLLPIVILVGKIWTRSASKEKTDQDDPS